AVLAAGVLAGFLMYINRPQNTPVSSPETIAEAPAAPANDEERQATESIAATAPPPPPAAQRSQPAEPATAPASASASPPASLALNRALDATLLGRTVDMLVSPQVAYQQKRDAWKQLKEAGKLDQVIADLEQRIANEPRAAEIPAALGQAYLKKCGTIQDLREQGILAMQADKAFDTALDLDPSNWEARFTKAVALSYWPPMMNKSEEAIQHFQTLIQQQETQTPQPQFAEP